MVVTADYDYGNYEWLYHVRMITYNKTRIITVEVFKLYGQKDGDRQLPLCSSDRL
ncbi:MAG: hypothetical protein AAGJ08_08135 [Cyanobacteria bacterium P01_H01_bin.35]